MAMRSTSARVSRSGMPNATMPYGSRCVARRWPDRGIPRIPMRSRARSIAIWRRPAIRLREIRSRSSRRTPASCIRGRSPLTPTTCFAGATSRSRCSSGLRTTSDSKAWRFTSEGRSTRRSGPWRSPSSARPRWRWASREIRAAPDGARARAFARDAAAVSQARPARRRHRAARHGTSAARNCLRAGRRDRRRGEGAQGGARCEHRSVSLSERAQRPAKLDDKVIEQVQRFDPDGLMSLLEAFPDHACGGGPTCR